MPVIGFLNSASPDAFAPYVGGFLQGLRDAGYVDGQNVKVEYRWAYGQYDRLPQLAAELVQQQVAVIVASGGEPSVMAAKAATSRTPIVFGIGGDPVKLGLVASLNRPGGNITGVSLLTSSLEAKRVGLLGELVPKAAVIAALINPNYAQAQAQEAEVQDAARTIGRQIVLVHATTEAEFEPAFARFKQQRAGALVVAADPFSNGRRNLLVALAARDRLPAVYEFREFAAAGGLMSYGTSLIGAYRQYGAYAAQILKGARPADLPVLQQSQRNQEHQLARCMKIELHFLLPFPPGGLPNRLSTAELSAKAGMTKPPLAGWASILPAANTPWRKGFERLQPSTACRRAGARW